MKSTDNNLHGKLSRNAWTSEGVTRASEFMGVPIKNPPSLRKKNLDLKQFINFCAYIS
jgi:hypothetical protein